MYLSRLILNPRSKSVRRDLADCQDLHRTVMSGFPPAPGHERDARAHYGVLYRLDMSPRSGKLVLYVQSRVEPDWSRLPDDYLLPGTGAANPACKPVGDLYRSIREGMVLTFRLRANPTRKIDTKSGPDGKRRNGKRVELRREEDQLAWLQRKAEAGGFALLQVRAAADVPDVRTAPEKVEGRHRAGGLTFGAVVFEGRLRVADPVRFVEALGQGIGPAKAYGFGLLSVAPG